MPAIFYGGSADRAIFCEKRMQHTPGGYRCPPRRDSAPSSIRESWRFMFRLIRKFRKSLRKEIRNWSNYLLYRYFSTVSAVLKWFRTTSDVAEATSKTGGVSRGKVRLSSLINPLFWIKEFWVFLIPGSTGGRLLIRRLLPAKIGYFGRKLSGVAVVKVQQLRASR